MQCAIFKVLTPKVIGDNGEVKWDVESARYVQQDTSSYVMLWRMGRYSTEIHFRKSVCSNKESRLLLHARCLVRHVHLIG